MPDSSAHQAGESALAKDLQRSLLELSETNTQLQSVIRQLEAMARTDELTGLSNRRWFKLDAQRPVGPRPPGTICRWRA